MTPLPLRRFRAPEGDDELLADSPFDAVPAAVERNRKLLDTTAVHIGDTPLSQFRVEARREIYSLLGLPDPNGPLILTGHQPELCHPGVWLKTFAAAGLAERLRGAALNLVVDTDEVKSFAVRIPIWDKNPAKVHAETVTFDDGSADASYASRFVHDEECFRSFPERAAKVTNSWGLSPLLSEAWPHAVHVSGTLGERFLAARSHYEVKWGCRVPTLTVTAMSRTESFRQFARHILNDLPRFAATYNRAVRDYRTRAKLKSKTHPVPELRDGEAPFWSFESGIRKPATATSDPATLVPRALTLTLFARLCVGDWFLHGIGGGKYDDVTDSIVRDYFGLEPPGFQVVTGTLRLPLPAFENSEADVARLTRLVRSLHWNPQQFVDGEVARRRGELTSHRPNTKAQRQARAAEIRELNERLRPLVAGRRESVERAIREAEAGVAANEILRSREYPWVLFPEATLRPFLQSVLAMAKS